MHNHVSSHYICLLILYVLFGDQGLFIGLRGGGTKLIYIYIYIQIWVAVRPSVQLLLKACVISPHGRAIQALKFRSHFLFWNGSLWPPMKVYTKSDKKQKCSEKALFDMFVFGRFVLQMLLLGKKDSMEKNLLPLGINEYLYKK